MAVTELIINDNEDFNGDDVIEFRLLYSGPLKASNGKTPRAFDKHIIRKRLHSQLKTLAEVQPPYSRWQSQIVPAANSPTGNDTTVIESVANNYSRNGYRFFPMIDQQRGLACELDILFMRREAPGKIVSSGGGDIDNRMKTLFDALRMPSGASELPEPPSKEEEPFYVLLQDDSLITRVAITTDRLLVKTKDEDDHKNNVHLVIGVKLKVVTVNRALSNLEFL